MAEIRLRELESVVDIFVRVEAKETFMGHKKHLTFPSVLANLPSGLVNRVRYFVLDSLDEGEKTASEGVRARAREQHQRRALLNEALDNLGLGRPQVGDIVLVSDADEVSITTLLFI